QVRLGNEGVIRSGDTFIGTIKVPSVAQRRRAFGGSAESHVGTGHRRLADGLRSDRGRLLHGEGGRSTVNGSLRICDRDDIGTGICQLHIGKAQGTGGCVWKDKSIETPL